MKMPMTHILCIWVLMLVVCVTPMLHSRADDAELCSQECQSGDDDGDEDEEIPDPTSCESTPDTPPTIGLRSPGNGPNGQPMRLEIPTPRGEMICVALTKIGRGATEAGCSSDGETKYDPRAQSSGVLIPRSAPTWIVGLGRDGQGQFAGQVELRPNRMFEDTLPISATLELHKDTGTPLDVVYDHQNALRQIMSEECLVTVNVQTNAADVGVTMSFYRPSEVQESLNEDGDYALTSNARPFVVYAITRSVTNDVLRTVRVTETRNGRMVSDKTFSRERLPSGNFSFGLSEGQGGRVKFKHVVSVQNGARTVKEIIRGLNGGERVTLKSYVILNDRELLTQTIEDPDGLAVTNRYEYVTNSLANGYGFVLRHTAHNGKITEYGYDGHCRKTQKLIRDPSGTMPEERFVYSYEPLGVHPHCPDMATGTGIADDTGTVGFFRPRREFHYVGGICVSATLRFLSTDTMNHRIEEEVRLINPSASDLVAQWDSDENPRTYVDYMPRTRCKPCSQRPSLVRHADGRIDKYDYASGEYRSESDGTAGNFIQISGGKWFRTITTHYPAPVAGTRSSNMPYCPVPRVTTRDVTIEIRSSKKVVQTERHVCTSVDPTTGEGAFARVSWTAIARDGLGRDTLIVSSDGTRIEKAYDGRLLASVTDADGLVTTYAYDELGRRISETKSGGGIRPDTTTTISYDFENRVLSRTVSSAGLSSVMAYTYDAIGRRDTVRESDGIVTKHLYATDLANGRATHVTIRGWRTDCAVTNEVIARVDGQMLETRLNGELKTALSYGADVDHTQWTQTFAGPSGHESLRWARRKTDALDRQVEERIPGFGNSELVSSNVYDKAGRLVAMTKSDTSGLLDSTLFCYNGDGSGSMAVRDRNLNGMIDWEHTDQIVSNGVSYVMRDGCWWRERVAFSAQENGSATLSRLRTMLTRLTGLGVHGEHGVLAAETVVVDEHGTETTECLWRDRAAHRTVNVADKPGSALSELTVTVCGLETEHRTSRGVTTLKTYDALGRLSSVGDGRGNVVVATYDAHGRVVSVADMLGRVTTYGYDALGRCTSKTDANGLTTTTAYDAEGRVISRRGATYPVDYTYDAFGNKVSMTTYRHEDLAEGDITRWFYDEATGLLTNKVYADGRGPSYSYASDGRLSVRTWARGVSTAYSYDAAGNCVSTRYSDGTPPLFCSYDRQGNLVSAVTEGVATNRYAYSATGLLTNEWQNGHAFTRTYDALGRPTGYTLAGGEIGPQAVSYGYDSCGRLAAVSSGAHTFTYAYLPGTDAVAGYTCGDFSREVCYDPTCDRISAVTNHFAECVVSSFGYVHDAAGRCVAIRRGGAAMGNLAGAVDAYGYNGRNEIVSARRTQAGMPVPGFSEDFAYDAIGNRTSATDYDESDHPRTSLYVANALNQYVRRTVPGWAAVRGLADSAAHVAINGNTAFRLGNYYFGSGDVDNSTQGGWVDLETYATVNCPTNDLVSAVTNQVFVPQTPEIFIYDADGNLAEDGRFRYIWNGENRLVRIEEKLPPEGRAAHVVTYAYDHLGRNVTKDGRMQVWDGYNIVVEDAVGTNATVNLWGLDIDGTLQGAGGVGGLLAVARGGAVVYPAYDANGNITEYVTAEGEIKSHTAYSAFGRGLLRNGEQNHSHGFSTKPWCRKSGLVEYQLRKNAPSYGRWLSRDKIYENGGIALYQYLRNNPFDVDMLGCASLWDWLMTVFSGPSAPGGMAEAASSLESLGLATLVAKLNSVKTQAALLAAESSGCPAPDTLKEIENLEKQAAILQRAINNILSGKKSK